MNIYNLVFSENRTVRFRRHLLFWTVWLTYLIVTYLIPTNWIPAWNIFGPMPHIAKYGVGLSVIRIFTAGVLLTLVHMGLVYGILYFFLPRYLSKRRSHVVTSVLLVVFVCCIAFVNYFNFVLSMYLSTRIGYFKTMPGMNFIIPLWGRQILFNYPTVVGAGLAIKLVKNWYHKQEEVAIVVREKINAELQLLKAQVHPHFLFNTLNNIYSFIINDSPAAPDALKKLCTLLRYIIYECNRPLVSVSKELKMIKDYIDLEKIRYGESFNMIFYVEGNSSDKMVCPLLLIPFLENSFKHGASQMLTHPWVRLSVVIEDSSLTFNLSNSKPISIAEKPIAKGLGLNNVKKRLAILYPESHSLTVSDDTMSYSIELTVPLFKPNKSEDGIVINEHRYELV